MYPPVYYSGTRHEANQLAYPKVQIFVFRTQKSLLKYLFDFRSYRNLKNSNRAECSRTGLVSLAPHL